MHDLVPYPISTAAVAGTLHEKECRVGITICIMAAHWRETTDSFVGGSDKRYLAETALKPGEFKESFTEYIQRKLST